MATTEVQKAKKFQELAQKRVTRALKAIEGLSKLAAPSRYSYTPKQIEQMEVAFRDALNHCFSGFKGGGTKASGGFKFS